MSRIEGESYIAAVVDAVAGNGVRAKGVEKAIVIFIAVEVVVGVCAPPGIR